MKQFILIFLLFLSIGSMAQKRIVMEHDGGVYKIPCKVNGAKMKMIFDTGASSVSISSSIAEYLFENDFIKKDDILGTGKSQIADGSIVDNVIINLRDVEIDGIHIRNVEATVKESLSSPLLFGQSAIQKLGPITIDGNILVINTADTERNNQDVEKLIKQVMMFCDNGQWREYINCLFKLQEIHGESDFTIRGLAVGYNMIGEYKVSLSYCDKYIDKYIHQADSSIISEFYQLMGENYWGLQDYNNAVPYYNTSLNYLKNSFERRCLLLERLAGCAYSGNQYYVAESYLKTLIDLMLGAIGIRYEDLNKKKRDEASLGGFLYYYSYTLRALGKEKDARYAMKAAAKCGYADAVKEERERIKEFRQQLWGW